MTLSKFDIDNMSSILSGSVGDWFSAHLLRLMVKADEDNLVRLGRVYPNHFIHFMRYRHGGVPSRYANIPEVYMEFGYMQQTNPDLMWEKDGEYYQNLTFTNGRDF
jgi:hypothetical protein